MKTPMTLAALVRVATPTLFCLSLAACGGGGIGGGGGGSSDGGGGTTAGNPGGDTGAGTTGSNGGGVVAADLSQSGTLLPRTDLGDDTTLISLAGRARAAAEPDALAIVYEVVENQGGDAPVDCAAVGANFRSCSMTNLHIKDADGALAGNDWKLYFHSLRRVLRVDSDALDVAWVNGDLHYLTPAAGYDGIDGEVATVRLVTEFSHLMQSDFHPRYWLVRDGDAPRLIDNTDAPDDALAYAEPITGDNRRAFNGEPIPLADPATRFAANADASARAAALSAAEVQARIVPRPTSLTLGAGALDISGGISFAGAPMPAVAAEALAERQSAFLSTRDNTAISMVIDSTLGAEAYALTVNASGIALRGGDEAGLFYAAQSVLSLVQPGTDTIPYVSVSDAPRFAFRGMHLDVARNFHTPETVRRLIDQMAAYKLNRLHLHLSDDEGWRLAIPSLPELAEIGGRRAFALDADGNVFEGAGLMPQLGSGPGANNTGSGFFTRDEFVALLRYADARQVQVLPEFDMPAHARAAVVAMRVRAGRLGDPDSTDIRIDDPADTSRYRTIQNYDDGILNPCVPGTYAFIETVVGDVAAMYAEADAPLDIWHMGGDEARNIYKGFGYGPSGVTFDEAAWDFPYERSPACADYIAATPGLDSREGLERHFVNRVADIVAAAGIPALYAWMDILDDVTAGELATTRAGVDFWEVISQNNGFDRISSYLDRGFETIVAVPDFTYFDFTQEVDPAERGQYWATRFIDAKKVFGFAPENLPQNAATSLTREGAAWSATGSGSGAPVQGLQGHLWSEVVRGGEQVDYMAYPRLLALAERAWHRAGWELDYAPGASFSQGAGVDIDALDADWAGFAAVLGQKELAKLDAAGVAYRIPVPGASTATGVLQMNVAYPGLPLEVAPSGSDFDAFAAGTTVGAGALVRARSADRSRLGRADAIE